jgi:NADH-quinone oxidoreductase subunit M
MLIPREQKNLIRWIALGVASFGLLVGVFYYFAYDPSASQGGYQFKAPVVRSLGGSPGSEEYGISWIRSLGIIYKVGVDGISLPLIVLTGIIALTGVLFSWNIEERLKEFFAFFFFLLGGVYGVFQSLDLFLLFVFYEIAIIPKYFIIAIWGSTRKEYAAMKLVLYSFTGSALVLIASLAVYGLTYAKTGSLGTFDLEILSDRGLMKFPLHFQMWAFPMMFVGFAVLAGMWPFHTWAPTGHVAAPTAASMLLAGVVMKLGAYGCLRVAMALFPDALTATLTLPSWLFHGAQIPQFWRWFIAVIATINIVYGAMVALVQKDFKFVIGYSSVSHMGFVLLGLVTLNVIGLSGAVIQMFSHGIIAGLLFAVVGRMVYERTHTRDLSELGGLFKAMPFVGVVFVIGTLASMGLPGFSGFFAEMFVLIGTWNAFPWLLIFVGLGVVITVVYSLRAVHKAFFGDRQGDITKWKHLAPVTLPESLASFILIALLLIVGLYPKVILDKVEPSVRQLLNRSQLQSSAESMRNRP